MNKYFKFMSVAAVALLAAACSSDEPNDGPNTGADKDGQAFMKVRINYADGGRATAGDFEYGKDFEHTVSTARFFFYDDQQNYVTEASVWNGGKPNDANPDANIEYFGNNVLVLSGLDNNNFPKYMLTVLNAPAGFTSKMTLQETADDILAQAADKTDGGIYSGSNFIMSTSSYGRTDADEPAFVNVLTTDNFKLSASDALAENNSVEVYVERLAAKVSVGVDNEAEGLVYDAEKGMYKLRITVSGDPNDQDKPGDNIGAADVYIKFNGWALSNTRKSTHLCKDIASVTAGLKFNWDNAARGFHRSWWGASVGYGSAVSTADLNQFSFNELNKKFYNEMATGVDNATYKTYVDYCAENTNTADNFNSGKKDGAGNELVDPRYVTSVLLGATTYMEVTENGVKSLKPVDLILYNGLYFTDKALRDYAMRYVQGLDKLNYYTKVDGKEEYHQLSADFATVITTGENASDVKVIANESAFTGVTVYSKNADGNGYTPITDNQTVISALNTSLAKVEGATGYKDGQMYYNIPIEHHYEASGNALEEGEYGVVRNHFYQLTVNSIKRLGHGVYDPNKDIIPDEEEDPKYYVGARINILSWKVVKQNVEL